MKGLHPEKREADGSHSRLLCGAGIPPFLAEHSPVTTSLILSSGLGADPAHFLKKCHQLKSSNRGDEADRDHARFEGGTIVTEMIIDLDQEQAHEQKDLSRSLKDRHIQMIAIGGAIGVGLFLGAARAIQKAGPGLMLSYILGGIVIFFIMRALGELLLHRPVAGSFATYAEEFVSPFAGFATGWSYWFMWVVVGMAEITAVAVYINYWFPAVPQWIPALITLIVLYGMNMIAVKLFGELEFWFALIKVVTIIALIVIGLVIILFGVSPLGPTAASLIFGAMTAFCLSAFWEWC